MAIAAGLIVQLCLQEKLNIVFRIPEVFYPHQVSLCTQSHQEEACDKVLERAALFEIIDRSTDAEAQRKDAGDFWANEELFRDLIDNSFLIHSQPMIVHLKLLGCYFQMMTFSSSSSYFS